MRALPQSIDWSAPDYLPIAARRVEWLAKIRANPEALPLLKDYYRDHPAQFIEDWGTISEPRNVERDLPTLLPFLLWPKQREWIDFVLSCWRSGEDGLTEKSRDSGVTWLAVALACTLCLTRRGMVVGFGSRTEDYVDKKGAPKCIFEKIRAFLQHLPVEFRGGWDVDRHSSHMRISFPDTGSVISGECGDNIGRGDRAAIYFVDEAAFLEHPDAVEAALSQTTRCRQDISTPNGTGNPFAEKRHSGRVKVFTFHWRDDPRKNDAWYRREVERLDPVTLAREVDIDYRGSVEGVLIPANWIQAAVGAHLKLGIEPSGEKSAGFDVADTGVDNNAMAFTHGIVLEHLHEWSGKGSDIFKTTVRAMALCEQYGLLTFRYDADGLGAGVRGDAQQINEQRKEAGKLPIADQAFRGSAQVEDPDGELVPGRKNKDFFANAKAQAWWRLRMKFERTYQALVNQQPYEADELISIDPQLEQLPQLINELSQPTYSINNVGKILVDKKPDGMRSPNLADAVVLAFHQPPRPAVWAFVGVRYGYGASSPSNPGGSIALPPPISSRDAYTDAAMRGRYRGRGRI